MTVGSRPPACASADPAADVAPTAAAVAAAAPLRTLRLFAILTRPSREVRQTDRLCRFNGTAQYKDDVSSCASMDYFPFSSYAAFL
ncbi:hypothetical protein Ade02nite_55690 [Paractinoplanes deccanensis]|uniref:Secreted protein n=1 Tax=Paractinoplanes deccanensis TaxID=113561 RepID=A0ABQ3YA82_9ACTN|nr:hypothetical protein Ade02nite_55690 [Actinoplanes deccanensis]